MQQTDQRTAPSLTTRISGKMSRLLAHRTRRPAGRTLLVWDMSIRAFHWLLVLAVAVAAVTGFLGGMTTLQTHLVAGVAVAVLVVARLVWGVLGSTHARFADFAYAPREVVGHLRDVLTGRVHRHLGHNPLGAVMVFALLTVLGGIVATGIVSLGGMFKQGPLGALASFAAGWSLLGVHQALAFALLAMIAGHLGGVAMESWRGRENLVAAMVTGRKRADPAADLTPVVRAWPRLSVCVLVGLGAFAAFGVVRLAAMPVPGLPPATLDSTYDAECGSCHYTYSPSLNPASVWTGIVDHLDQHFGEDASMGAAKTAKIRAYLVANSAEHWDTLAAHMLRSRDPAHPWRITDTPYWRHIHAGIPASVFASKAVVGRASCNSCHSDAASGRFAPQNIAVPEAAE